MKSRKILTIALLILPLLLLAGVLVSVSIYNYQQKLKGEAEASKLSEAKIEMEQRNYKNASRLYSDLIMVNDQDFEAVLGMNSVYMVYGDYNNSKTLLSKYTNSNDLRIELALANTYYGIVDLDNAMNYSKAALATDNSSEEALTILLKSINLSLDKDELDKIESGIDIKQHSLTSQFYLALTKLNFGIDPESQIKFLQDNMKADYTDIVSTYTEYYAATLDSKTEMQAKAEIVKVLISHNLLEFANPFAEDLYKLNKYYEDGVVFRSIINNKMGDFQTSITDLQLILQYDPESINAKVLLLEAYLGANDAAKGQDLVQKLILSYTSANELKYYEALKILYNYHFYDLYWNMYLGVGSQLEDYATAVNYMAMQVSVYHNDRSLLPLIINKVFENENSLSVSERANFTAGQALVAYDQADSDKAVSLMGTAEDLYFYSPFVQYVKSIIYNDPTYLERAYELDVLNEIPAAKADSN